jgi:dihydrolipoamide dehydrogenase
MLREEGLIRVYADKCSGTLLGAAMVAPRGEHLAHLLAWSIQRRMTVWDLLEMPFYHPVIEEILQGALTDLAGKLEVETDFPLGFASV